uniref:Alternative protein AQR n=1 Tax=Homo sapiens TaxID=9606 RepID=L8E9N8_HUMAN|nr:alternative protein AQR [Homo sapiens]
MCMNNSSFICSIRRANNHSFHVLITECVCNHTYIKIIFYEYIIYTSHF